MSDKTPSEGPEVNLTYAQQLKLRREEHLAKYRANRLPTIEPPPTEPANRLLKYSPTCGLPPLALALFFRQVSVS